jgi:cell division protein FtsZ
MIELPRPNSSGQQPELSIKVIGLGGAGANALDRIQLDGIDGAELIAMNTDAQALAGSVAPVKIQLGRATTRGLGTGGDPELGYSAADEAADEVKAVLDGARMVFLCTGLGGGTGSGAAPLIANFARQTGAIVVAFATMPFTFEGRRRMAQAEEALASLTQQADVVVCFENDRMGDAVSPRAGIHEAFAAADQTLSQSVRAIASILQRRGLVRVGFDELSAALRSQHPRCLFGCGDADGDNRAHAALERALRSPLMDRGRLLADAHSLLVHVAGGASMTLNEVTLLMEELNRHISDTTRLLFSASVDPRLGGKMSVTLISSIGVAEPATAFAPPPRMERATPPPMVHHPVPVAAPIAAEPEPEPAAVQPLPQPPMLPVHTPQQESLAIAASAEPTRAPRSTGKAKPTREEKQEQMQFEPVNRGRFEKSEPTIVDGQDLDVPAFMRMNVRVK